MAVRLARNVLRLCGCQFAAPTRRDRPFFSLGVLSASCSAVAPLLVAPELPARLRLASIPELGARYRAIREREDTDTRPKLEEGGGERCR